MIYETNLLDFTWWIENLIGNMFLFIALLQIWLLSFIRKIPNIDTFSLIIVAVNVLLMVYGIFAGGGLNIGTSILGVITLIYAFIAWKGYS